MYGTAEELRRKGFEPVHVEIERYDGPASGIADVDGVPHYFHRDDSQRDLDVCLVWPVDDATLALEREQWRVFVTAWDQRFQDDESTWPNARYEELRALLEPRRVAPPGARRLKAEWSFADDLEERYYEDSTDYLVRWSECAQPLPEIRHHERRPPV